MVTTWGQRIKPPSAADSFQLGDVKGRTFDRWSQFRFTWLASGHTDSNPACVVFHYALLIYLQFSCSVVSDSLWPHGLQHNRSPFITNSRSLPKLVHWVGDANQPSHPLSPSPPALNLSQPRGLFKWVCPLHQVAKELEFQLQHQSFQWIFRTDFL